MRVGLIGAGSLARALARGWGDPVLCSDAGSGRARALAEELGGEALDSNLEVAARADLVVLGHKPPAPGVPGDLETEVVSLFGRLGSVVTLPERLVEPAAAVTAVGPAYGALIAEAQVDAAVRHGLGAELAGRLVAETMAGTAALLAEGDYDTLAVRPEVASPGGTTARGLAALDKAGLRSAFQEAFDAVLAWSLR